MPNAEHSLVDLSESSACAAAVNMVKHAPRLPRFFLAGVAMKVLQTTTASLDNTLFQRDSLAPVVSTISAPWGYVPQPGRASPAPSLDDFVNSILSESPQTIRKLVLRKRTGAPYQLKLAGMADRFRVRDGQLIQSLAATAPTGDSRDARLRQAWRSVGLQHGLRTAQIGTLVQYWLPFAHVHYHPYWSAPIAAPTPAGTPRPASALRLPTFLTPFFTGTQDRTPPGVLAALSACKLANPVQSAVAAACLPALDTWADLCLDLMRASTEFGGDVEGVAASLSAASLASTVTVSPLHGVLSAAPASVVSGNLGSHSGCALDLPAAPAPLEDYIEDMAH